MTTATKVVILSAGRGFRMNPITLERPKALCPVANVTLLRRILDQICAAGIEQAVLALPSGASPFQAMVAENAPCGFKLDIAFFGGERLGQVGILRRTLGSHKGTVLVVYGDSLLSADFGRLVDVHCGNQLKGGMATILCHRPKDLRIAEKDGRTYHGVMSVDAEGLVTRFEEKPLVSQISASFELANAAVFAIESDLLNAAGFKEAKNFSFDVFQPAVKQSLPIYACDIERGFRFDVGDIRRWWDLNMRVIRKEINAPAPGREEQPGVWLADSMVNMPGHCEPPVLVGQDVSVGAGATLGPDVIVGDGCRIGNNTLIRKTVLLEGCYIGNDVEIDCCVIGPHCRITDGVRLPKFSCLGAYSVQGGDSWPNWATEERYSY